MSHLLSRLFDTTFTPQVDLLAKGRFPFKALHAVEIVVRLTASCHASNRTRCRPFPAVHCRMQRSCMSKTIIEYSPKLYGRERGGEWDASLKEGNISLNLYWLHAGWLYRLGLGTRQMAVELGKLYIITDYTAPFCLLTEP